MTPRWEPGTQYNRGDKVVYEGVEYKIIQAHFSQGDWAPNLTPALWGRCGPADEPEHHQWRPGPGHDHCAPTAHYGDDDEKRDHSERDDHEKDWKEKAGDFFTPERKKQLGIAGGVLGAAALIGGGVYAYSKHKSHEEEEVKKREWEETTTEETYTKNVEMRSEMHARGDHEQRGQKVYWIGTGGGDIPHNAIRAAEEEGGEELFICRTFHEGGVHPGKCGRHLQGGGAISYRGREISVTKYEVLVGERDSIRWVELNGPVTVQGYHPVEAGRERSGEFLFVALGEHRGRWIPGKIKDGEEVCLVPYGGEEVECRRYKLAVYA